MLNGYYIKDSYKGLVKIVRDTPEIDNYNIANIIGGKENCRQLVALTDSGF